MGPRVNNNLLFKNVQNMEVPLGLGNVQSPTSYLITNCESP